MSERPEQAPSEEPEARSCTTCGAPSAGTYQDWPFCQMHLDSINAENARTGQDVELVSPDAPDDHSDDWDKTEETERDKLVVDGQSAPVEEPSSDTTSAPVSFSETRLTPSEPVAAASAPTTPRTPRAFTMTPPKPPEQSRIIPTPERSRTPVSSHPSIISEMIEAGRILIEGGNEPDSADKKLPPMSAPASFVETEELRKSKESIQAERQQQPTPERKVITEQPARKPRALPKPPERPNTEHSVNKPPTGGAPISKRPRLKLVGVPRGRKAGSTNAFIWYNLVYKARHGQYATGLPRRMHSEYDAHPKMLHARAHVRGTFTPTEEFIDGNAETLKRNKQWPSIRRPSQSALNNQRQHA